MTVSEEEVISKLISLLSDPSEEWVSNRYTIQHDCGIKIWIANGRGHVKIYPNKKEFSWINKWRIWQAVEIARNNEIIRKISSASEKNL